MTKYKAVKTEVDGITFASKKEARKQYNQINKLDANISIEESFESALEEFQIKGKKELIEFINALALLE